MSFGVYQGTVKSSYLEGSTNPNSKIFIVKLI